MPRNPPRKTTIGSFTEEQMRDAVNLVIQGRSLRAVATEKELSFQTLARYVKKQKDNPDESIRMTPNYSVNKVFTDDQETALAEYYINSARMFYGLPLLECRKLAYELAVANKLKIPGTWEESKVAGVEWMRNFMRRHPSLSLRTAEGCSLSRATSFNKHNVGIFFENLRTLMERHPDFSDGTRIYNLDESGTTTLQKPQKIVAEKGIKQVSKATSAEKGTLVTTCAIISATGNSIPPVMIFPRVHFKEHMVAGAPSGTLGLATQSGWMNSELFLQVMKHFIKHTKSSKESPTLLIYDNHESHLSIAVLDLAKENGVNILTLPPHSSNKLQPLDVGVFKPFMTAYNAAIDSWILHNPGKTATIYQVASFVGIAYQKAFTPANITSAFKKCGIFPYDSNVFTDIDFMSSAVSDRPLQSTDQTPAHPEPLHSSDQSSVSPGSSSAVGAAHSPAFITPEEIRTYPHSEPRQQTTRRRKGKSIIATDTPEKQAIEERHSAKKKKNNHRRKQLFQKDKPTSDEDSEVGMDITHDNDSSSDESNFEDPAEVGLHPDIFEELQREPKEEDFVLVEFKDTSSGKNKSNIFYVGKILKGKDDGGDFEITFLRHSSKNTGKFIFPNVEDLASVAEGDIKMILPQPVVASGSTKRQMSIYSFGVDFSLMNIH